ncbi:hypothetical protein WJX79_001574 [Trebouxia sp. C0005]
MSPQSWHGLSHKNAWSDVGDSYSKLAQRSEKIDESNASPAYGSLSCLPAGVVSRTKPKGAGSFQLQSDWSLSTDASGLRSYGTEATEKFRSPPSGARPAVSQAHKGKSSNFPKETYAADYRTYNKIDFDAVRLAGCTKPARAPRPADSGLVLGTSSFSSSTPQAHAAAAGALPKQATLRSPLTDGTMRDSAGITLPVYNIITGEAPKHNDKSKYWSGQNMDYRRRR